MASAILDHLLENVYGTPIPHGILEAMLLISLLWIIFKKSYDPRGPAAVGINDLKVALMVKEWSPEPLVKDIKMKHPALKPKLITGKVGKYTQINGIACLNLGSHNYLGFLGNPDIEESAIATLLKYGVGSCGPRGFYGTVDVHLALEEQLAAFMGMEEAAVYSYGFSTVASVIPAYAKRGDIIFVDKEVNFAVQKGLDASRSKIVIFEHNNVQHLENLLEEQNILDKQNPRRASATRRFLVVEGIYMNTGTICNLPELMRIKDKYKLRIILDESVSFGTLGANGKGVTEHFGIPVADVDLIVASLEWAVASIGGFSVGSSYIIEHQRLSALGYCFSASLPPLLTTAASTALAMMQADPSMFSELKSRCLFFHKIMCLLPKMDLHGDPESPIKHFTIKNSEITIEQQEQLLAKIVEFCLEHRLIVVASGYLESERFPHQPSLRIAVNRMLDDINIQSSALTILDAVQTFL